MSRFVIACPKGQTSGGPEALHQLAKEITDLGFAALLWDPVENRGALESASAYEGHRPTWTETPPAQGDIVVIPEIYGHLIPRFYLSCQIIFWWLSVDNYFATDRISIDVLNVLFPDIIHCYQSEYARMFLNDIGIKNSLPLSDYLNAEFVNTAEIDSHSSLKTGNTLIAVNPAKGFERTLKGLQGMNEDCIIKLEQMSRDEIIDQLANADIYLDLGNHPGTDRLPREAALMNCVVVTNNRGSAANQIDVPIEKDIFKIDDDVNNFHVGLQLTLKKIGADPGKYLAMQSSYRTKIRQGKDLFVNEVDHLIQETTKRKFNLHLQISQNEKSLINLVADCFQERDAIIQERDAIIQERDAIIQERDAIIQERDAIIQERDAIIQERDASFSNFRNLIESVSWKVTRPLRFLHRTLCSYLEKIK